MDTRTAPRALSSSRSSYSTPNEPTQSKNKQWHLAPCRSRRRRPNRLIGKVDLCSRSGSETIATPAEPPEGSATENDIAQSANLASGALGGVLVGSRCPPVPASLGKKPSFLPATCILHQSANAVSPSLRYSPPTSLNYQPPRLFPPRPKRGVLRPPALLRPGCMFHQGINSGSFRRFQKRTSK